MQFFVPDCIYEVNASSFRASEYANDVCGHLSIRLDNCFKIDIFKIYFKCLFDLDLFNSKTSIM